MDSSANNNNTMLKFVVLSISFLIMTRMSISPALADMGKAFPDVSQTLLMATISIPGLIVVPFSILSGMLVNRFKTKSILLIGLIIFLIGGVGPIFVNSFGMLMFFRCILGAGIGLFMPFSSGLIGDLFSNQTRLNLMGYMSTSVNLGNIITTLIGGFLCTVAWNYTFLVYLVALPIMLLIIYKLPEPIRNSSKKEKVTLNGKIYFITFLSVIFTFFQFVIYGQMAFLIDTQKLGNAGTAGIALTIATVGALLAGLTFGKIRARAKEYQFVIGIGLSGIGFLLIALSSGLGMIMVGCFIAGLGFGNTLPEMVYQAMQAAPTPASMTLASALPISAANVGTFLSAVILFPVLSATGIGFGRSAFLTSSVAFIVMAVLFMIRAIRNTNKQAVRL